MRSLLGKIFFIVILTSGVCLSSMAQSHKYIGKIVEKGNGSPVAGVYILLNHIPVTFTNLNGIFDIEAFPSDTISIRHLIYKSFKINCSELSQDTNFIQLENSIFELPEVRINIETTRSIIKKAHKLFRKHYRTSSFWAKSHYRQLVSYQEKYRSYMECSGYTFLPAPDHNVYSYQLCQIPFEIRKSREDPVLTQAWKEKGGLLLITPSYPEEGGEFPFLEYIHPLGNFHHGSYHFRRDTLGDHTDLVFLFRQKKSGFSVGGWWINRCCGKIYLNPQTYQLKKLECLFYKEDKLNQIEVSYCEKNKALFPQNIKMEYTHPSRSNGSKTFVDSEYDFSWFDTIQRPNYKRMTGDYNFLIAILDLPYRPAFWKAYPLQGKWKKGMQELCPDNNTDEEFQKGAQQKFIDKTYKYYHYLTKEKLLQPHKQLIEQLKKDLNIP